MPDNVPFAADHLPDDGEAFTAAIRKAALKLMAASRDAARESRFEGGSRGRKAVIAEEATPFVEAAGNAELAQRLVRLAAKLRATDCWGARPRQGLSEAFGEAARLIHPLVEADLANLQQASTERSARQMADVFARVLGGPSRT